MQSEIAEYRARGWATIRVQPNGKSPIGQWANRVDEPEDFQLGENVGVRLGEPSGHLIDIDLDSDEAVALAPALLPATATFGRGGQPRHYFYACTTATKTKRPPQAMIELRSTGAQTVIPPSVHPSGEVLTWYRPLTDLARVTEVELLAAFGRLCVATIVARCMPRLAEGHAVHHASLALAGALWSEGWSCEDACDVLLPAFVLHGGEDTGHREQAIRDTWEGEADRPRYGWPTVAQLLGPVDCKALERACQLVRTTPRATSSANANPDDIPQRPLTDAGNAERFVDDTHTDLRYAPGLGWLQWDGRRWESLDGEPIDLAIRSARALQQRGDAAGHQWGLKSEAAGKLTATLRLARELPGVRTDASLFDADPLLLCTPSGVVDLATGQLREHRQDDLITHCTRVPYLPGTKAPRFAQFLLEIFDNDEELALYVCRYLAYCFTGLTREQVFQVWHGQGSNGKSVLIDTVRYVLGDYAQILSPGLLLARATSRDSGAASPDVARLRGVRFAAGVETDEDQRWNESAVKQLTGSDRITARHLYREYLEFDPTHKLILAVNHKPVVRGSDHGIWRRIHLVGFNVTFEGERQDRTLPGKLRDEGPGILSFLVDQCRDYLTSGLQTPQTVIDAVQDYRESQDVVGSFLRECVREGGSTPLKRMYEEYKRWCSTSGEYQHPKHTFNNRLRDRGHRHEKRSGTPQWIGLTVVNPA